MAQYDQQEDYASLQTYIAWDEAPQAAALGKLILETLAPKSVIDIGCGPGLYLVPFRDAGAVVQGIDWCESAGKSLSMEEFAIVDLREPYFSARKFDLAMCVEVAEHLRPEFAETLVDSVCRMSDIVFWSAARVGQGGLGHFNEQPKGYWIDKFLSRGYGIHPLDRLINNTIDTDDVYSHCGWLRSNTVIFQR